MLGAFLLLTILLIPVTSVAQVAVETDRPDAANSTRTVPPGHAQLEAGYRHTSEQVAGAAPRKRSSAETTVRVGVTPALELRLDGESYVDMHNSASRGGIGDLIVGAKWRLLDASTEHLGASLALAPFLKIPTADRPIGSERADFGLLGLVSFDGPGEFSADVNVGIAVLGQRHGEPFFVQGLAAGSLGYKVLKTLTGFGEVFLGSSPEPGGRAFLGAGVGVIWVAHRRLALDAAVDTMLTGRGPDFGFRIGATLLFGP